MPHQNDFLFFLQFDPEILEKHNIYVFCSVYQRWAVKLTLISHFFLIQAILSKKLSLTKVVGRPLTPREVGVFKFKLFSYL